MTGFFLEMVNRSLSASYLVLLIVLLRWAFRRMPKWVVVLLWGFVAFRLVCPVIPESRISMVPSGEVISQDIAMSQMPEVQTGISSVDSVVNPVMGESFAPDPAASVNPLQLVLSVLSQVWLLGVAGMGLYTAASYLRLRRSVGDAVELQNHIYQCETVSSPFILGVWQPRIYLPDSLSAEEAEYVIAHERTHLRRRDHWWKPFGFFLLTLTWFNPAMWLAYILLCRDIEIACDEAAVRNMEPLDRAQYSQTLLNLSIPRRQIAACPLAFGEIGVKERVRRVLSYKRPAFWILVLCLILCCGIAVTFLTNPSTAGLDILHGLTAQEIVTIQSSSFTMEDEPLGVTFYAPEDGNLHRILPVLQQAKGTPIARPWGAKENADIRFISIFGRTEIPGLGREFLTVEIVNNRYLVVEDYWYEADPQWLATLPPDQDYYLWLTTLHRDQIQKVEYLPSPGCRFHEADVDQLVRFLNHMQIPAVGHPDVLPEVQATYRLTMLDGMTRDISILGTRYILIGDVLYDVGGSLEELITPPQSLEQPPLPENVMAAWVRTGSGQSVALIQEAELLTQMLALFNQGVLQKDAQVDWDAEVILYWPNGAVLNLPLSSQGTYFKMGDSVYSYGPLSQTESMQSGQTLWQLLGFTLPQEEYESLFAKGTFPLYLPNQLYGEAVVLPEGTTAISGGDWNEGSSRPSDRAFAVIRRGDRYWLRTVLNGGFREQSFRKLMSLEKDGKHYFVLTRSLFGVSDLDRVRDDDYVLIPGT